MARNKVQPCIFCNEVPCSCNGPKQRPTAPKQRRTIFRPVETVEIPDKPEVRPPPPDYDKPDVNPFDLFGKQVAKFSPTQEISQDEMIFNECIRNLGPILHRDEVARFQHILSGRPNSPRVERALADYRARHLSRPGDQAE